MPVPLFLARTLAAALVCILTKPSFVFAQSNVQGDPSAATRYIFAFGDSYTATGFNASKIVPSIGNTFGNPDYPGYTSSGFGDANWIDYLVHDKAPANTLCYNFAWFGATVSRSSDEPPLGQYYTFTDQIQEFRDVKNTASWNADNALFTVWFGINDIALNTALGLPLENGASATNRYDGVTRPYFDQLNILSQAGARDFLLFTLPPIDRAPIALQAGPQTVANILTNVTAFNQVLRDEAQVFLNEHPSARISIVDTSIPFNQVLNSPTQNGAANASCDDSNGHSCLWSNNAHPATAIHQALSEAVFQQLSDLGYWGGAYNAGPVEVSSQTSNSSSLRSTGSTWLAIFLAGFVVGRSTGLRNRSLRYDVKL